MTQPQHPDHPAAVIPRPKILVVDDTPANLLVMRKLLAKVDADLVEAASGNAALAASLDHEFALILLDVQMPDMDGFEVAEFLSQEERTRDTPIIFVTAAYADDLNRVKGYGSGAVDYIVKPINDVILLSKVRVFLELYRGKQQLRQLLGELDTRNRQLQEEIAERQRLEELARHQATHDPLTGLPNRLLFIDRLEKTIERAQRRGKSCALFYIDIDEFKPINDRYGHHAGDALLKGIARRMEEAMRKVDTVARLGGDEFAAIMEEPADAPDALQAAQRLGESLRRPYRLELPDHPDGLLAQVGASIGIALFPQHAANLEALVQAADKLMYRAKKSGKNQCLMAEQPLA
ncbi:MAG TPA: diguanylate cyclase [Nevskia sp.]|jgi:diguanylate cyclase (GGDEF)-like protein|nr:diguanylate cyclase [Nevskia sp.]